MRDLAHLENVGVYVGCCSKAVGGLRQTCGARSVLIGTPQHTSHNVTSLARPDLKTAPLLNTPRTLCIVSAALF